VSLCMGLSVVMGTAAVWPSNWDSKYRPGSLCPSGPKTGQQRCTVFAAAPTASVGAEASFRAALSKAKTLGAGTGASACPLPIVVFNFAVPLTKPLIITSNLVLWFDTNAKISAGAPATWPADASDSEKPATIITISGKSNATKDLISVAFCGWGTGATASGGIIDGNLWYSNPKKPVCGNEMPKENRPKTAKWTGTKAPDLLIMSNFNGFTLEGLQFINSPRYTITLNFGYYMYVNKLWIQVPALVENDCNVDGIHLNSVMGAIITHSTVASGDDNIVAAYGNEYVAITNSNLFNGHGATLGQHGLSSDHNYCNRHIVFDSVTGVDQAQSVRLKASAGENYQHRDISWLNFCVTGSKYAARIETAQNDGGKKPTGTYLGVTWDVTIADSCPNRITNGVLTPLSAPSRKTFQNKEYHPADLMCSGDNTVICDITIKNWICSVAKTKDRCDVCSRGTDDKCIKFKCPNKKLFVTIAPGVAGTSHLPPACKLASIPKDPCDERFHKYLQDVWPTRPQFTTGIATPTVIPIPITKIKPNQQIPRFLQP